MTTWTIIWALIGVVALSLLAAWAVTPRHENEDVERFFDEW